MANNQIIGRWKKQPLEELRYEVDWSKWLLPGESLLSAHNLVVEDHPGDLHPLQVSEPYFLAGYAGCVFFVRGGSSHKQYQVTHWVTTSAGQRAEREIFYDVEDA